MTRRDATIGTAMTIGVGLASRRYPVGVFLWDKSLGDALYAAMLYFFVALGRPTTRPSRLGASALGISIAVELFQLTGIPEKMPRVLQITLGTSFGWHDIACYIVGAGAVTIGHTLWPERPSSDR